MKTYKPAKVGRKTILNSSGTSVLRFDYPEHYTQHQMGQTLPIGAKLYFEKGLGGRGAINARTKVRRIISPSEQKVVAAAKKDIGHKKRKKYSKIAQRRVPRALHSLYGLPMKDCNRTKRKQINFR